MPRQVGPRLPNWRASCTEMWIAPEGDDKTRCRG